MKRLTRTLVYEGSASWLDAILALNYLGPNRPVAVQPEGTIRETAHTVDDLPDAPDAKEIARELYKRSRKPRTDRKRAKRIHPRKSARRAAARRALGRR